MYKLSYLHDKLVVCDVHMYYETWKEFELMCIQLRTSKSFAYCMCLY